MSNVTKLNTSVEIDEETETRCAERLRVARELMTKSWRDYLEAGRQMSANKKELGKGNWAKWCKANGLALSTTDALVRIADRFADEFLATSEADQLVATTSSDTIRVDVEAMRLLASPAVPEPVAAEVIERAKRGEHITKAVAKKVIGTAPPNLGKLATALEDQGVELPQPKKKKPKEVEAPTDTRFIDFQIGLRNICNIEHFIASEIARALVDLGPETLEQAYEAIDRIQAVINSLEEDKH
jgi:hypothetical protein